MGKGTVITFYSYKGGVGRSMALANIGILLANWGKKVLMVDWDLEAPGLENYFKDHFKEKDISGILSRNGIIDILHQRTIKTDFEERSIQWDNYLIPINLTGNSKLCLLTAGKRDDEYISKVRQFDFSTFYNEHDGGDFLEDIRTRWKDEYDFILIDSRTGLTDSSGICSIHMPDVLLLFFTATEQGFKGTMNVVNRAKIKQEQLIYDRLRLISLPIPTRFDNSELKLTEEWLSRFAHDLTKVYEEFVPQTETGEYLIQPIDILKKTKIPYISFYGYGEKLPVIEQGVDDPNTIGYVYETIAAILANNFKNIQKLKDERDFYIKMAKGDEIKDFSHFEKKIAEEQKEKEKLLAELTTIKARQRKTNRTIVYSLVGIAATVLVIVFSKGFNSNSASKIEVVTPEAVPGMGTSTDPVTRMDTVAMIADTARVKATNKNK